MSYREFAHRKEGREETILSNRPGDEKKLKGDRPTAPQKIPALRVIGAERSGQTGPMQKQGRKH